MKGEKKGKCQRQANHPEPLAADNSKLGFTGERLVFRRNRNCHKLRDRNRNLRV